MERSKFRRRVAVGDLKISRAIGITSSAPAWLGREIDGDELPGFWIEDGHEGPLFCWHRRNATKPERIKPP
jgi:hypothetical protein